MLHLKKEKINKRTLTFNKFFLVLSFFSHKNALVMQFSGKRKITLNYAMFININGSCQCIQIKTFMSYFSSVYRSILSKMVCTFWMTFCMNSIRISCQIVFVNKHWPQLCPSPFKDIMDNEHGNTLLHFYPNN